MTNITDITFITYTDDITVEQSTTSIAIRIFPTTDTCYIGGNNTYISCSTVCFPNFYFMLSVLILVRPIIILTMMMVLNTNNIFRNSLRNVLDDDYICYC